MAQPTFARPAYTRRRVPHPMGQAQSVQDVNQSLADLSAWLGIELQNLQRAIAPFAVLSVSASTTLTVSTGLCLVDATAAAVTVTLPDPTTAQGLSVTVKKVDASGHAVTVVALGGGTIDGATSQTLAAQWNSKTFVSDGAAYYITATV